MHGLIFETSIWLLAGSTRFLPSKPLTIWPLVFHSIIPQSVPNDFHHHSWLCATPSFDQIQRGIQSCLFTSTLPSCSSHHASGSQFSAPVGTGCGKATNTWQHCFNPLCWAVFSAPLLAQGAEKPPLHNHTRKLELPTPIFGRGNPYQQNRKKKEKKVTNDFFSRSKKIKTKNIDRKHFFM